MDNKIYYSIVLLFSIILLSACSSSRNGGLIEEGAMTTQSTKSGFKLRSLPPPLSKIPTAIYQFRDQTGQYKEKESGSSFSSAVTQGATPILIKAIQDSGWFIPVEREGLQNLLTERKIARSSTQKMTGKRNTSTPALRSARILLEGGITGFESNMRTGGEGAEYFGINASRQYREDFVTVHLRAIDIKTGQVLTSVSTSKRLLSFEYRTGLFRYVKYKRLLGIEAGYTSNEPSHLCVTDAIEKAVHDLILKGIDLKVWKFKNPQNNKSLTMQQYWKEQKKQHFKGKA
jgi:curli production assembly/transport component CsgG